MIRRATPDVRHSPLSPIADLLADLGRSAGCTVYLSVPTVDEEAWRALEPGTVIEVRITAGGYLGKVVRYRIRRACWRACAPIWIASRSTWFAPPSRPVTSACILLKSTSLQS